MSEPVVDQTDQVNQARLASLGMMVAGISHELNTPLGAINSNHDVIERALNKLQVILEDEVVTQDELQEVRKIVRAMDGVLRTNSIAVERMVKLVESLRTFGRPDRADVDRVDLHEGLESTLAVLGFELAAITVDRAFAELPLVECYPNRINQVFMNLLHNAVQAMPDGGTLKLMTSSEGDRVRLEISDTGRGISPEHLAEIFEPGFTTKGGRVGMGLGLAITHQIVAHHGGDISVSSTVGEGTTFVVELPLRLPKDHAAREGGNDVVA